MRPLYSETQLSEIYVYYPVLSHMQCALIPFLLAKFCCMFTLCCVFVWQKSVVT